MANVVNRTTKEYLTSVDTKKYSIAQWIINPDIAAVTGWETKYWIIPSTASGNVITLMDITARNAVDAEEESKTTVVYRNTAIDEISVSSNVGVRTRANIQNANQRCNFNTNRITHNFDSLSRVYNAIVNSVGGADAIRSAVAAVDISPLATSTRTLQSAIAAYKEDINTGDLDS